MGSLSDRCGTPVRAIRWARQQHATPRDPFHDPYLAALLVAVAQEKKKWSQRYARDELPPQEFKVCALLFGPSPACLLARSNHPPSVAYPLRRILFRH